MNDLISIITPVYNSGLYLNSCIHSVMQQTFPYYELLLIDDGSQDESRAICEKACKSDQRIHFIHQAHQGVSSARNKGIKAANGTYLFFLDSDDLIHPYLLEILYTIMNRTHSVMAATEYYYIEKNSLSELNIKLSSPTQYLSDYIHINNQIILDIFTQGHTQLLYGIGGLMIRRTNTKKLFFDEKLANGEDTKYIYQMLLLGADTIILNRPWYYYRKYASSSSKRLTIASCRSMYKCECYMRNKEEKNQRIVNAITQEQILINRIREWYITGRSNHDMQLCNYLKKIAVRECTSHNFLRINSHDKIIFLLALYCPPLYFLYNVFLRLITSILY